MSKPLTKIFALVLALAACQTCTVEAASAAAQQSDTGGSAAGDFGPPQGEPIQAVLTSAPNVPPPVNRDYPAKVIVDMEVRELDMEISEGVTYTFWTFGGTVPGSFIRIRQGGHGRISFEESSRFKNAAQY